MVGETKETKRFRHCNEAVTQPPDTAQQSAASAAHEEISVSVPHVDSAVSEHSAPLQRPAPQHWLRRLWFRPQGRLDEIRQRMLTQLGTVADAQRRAGLAVRIKSAADSEALWALRRDWMQALTEAQGELLARQRMSEVSFMFAGMLDRKQHVLAVEALLNAEMQGRLVLRTEAR